MNFITRIKIHLFEAPKLIRSIYFCFRYLPLSQAVKMPVFLDVPIKVCKLRKGNIVFSGNIKSRQVFFGEGISGFPAMNTNIHIEKDSKIIFRGTAFIARGNTLRVDSGGILEIGNNFAINKNSVLRCSGRITISDNVLFGWNNEINDNDGHPTYVDSKKTCEVLPILIGPHVWVTSHVLISKNVTIPEGCVVAKGAVVTKKHDQPNTLIGGIPAKDIKQGITWSFK